MPQDQQIDDELYGDLILVRTGACRQSSYKIRHAERLRQAEEPRDLLRLQHRDISVVHASELI